MAKKNRWPYAKRKALLRLLSDSNFQNTYTSETIHAAIIPERKDNHQRQWVTTRSLIDETRLLHSVPIVGCRLGYYIARTWEDIERVTETNRKTALTILNNIMTLENIFTKHQKPKRKLKRRKK